MRLKTILAILIILFLIGCKQEIEKGVVDNLSGGGEETVIENETLDNKALFEKLMEGDGGDEAGEGAINVTGADDANETTEEVDNKALFEELLGGGGEEGEEETAEEPTSGIKEVTIYNFKGDPEDFSITAGTTVRWTNLMYFKNIIIILPKEDDGTYSSRWINDLEELWYNETYNYTFNNTGIYKWGSKTKFDKIQGIVTVS